MFQSPSFPRRRESSDFRLDVRSESHWVPAFAGTTSIRLSWRMRLLLVSSLVQSAPTVEPPSLSSDAIHNRTLPGGGGISTSRLAMRARESTSVCTANHSSSAAGRVSVSETGLARSRGSHIGFDGEFSKCFRMLRPECRRDILYPIPVERIALARSSATMSLRSCRRVERRKGDGGN
jgi:hypothetical protein